VVCAAGPVSAGARGESADLGAPPGWDADWTVGGIWLVELEKDFARQTIRSGRHACWRGRMTWLERGGCDWRRRRWWRYRGWRCGADW
jgi:hypothetical protein